METTCSALLGLLEDSYTATSGKTFINHKEGVIIESINITHTHAHTIESTVKVDDNSSSAFVFVFQLRFVWIISLMVPECPLTNGTLKNMMTWEQQCRRVGIKIRQSEAWEMSQSMDLLLLCALHMRERNCNDSYSANIHFPC